MEDFGQFLFLAAGAVSLFAFLSVAHWVDASVAERQTRARMALLRKVAEQPAETARLVLELLREDEAKANQQVHQSYSRTRRNGIQTGSVLIAFGLSLGMAFAVASRRYWAIGLIPLFVGVVVLAFAWFDRSEEKPRSLPEGR